jgi:alpha-amylase/alpha-mannosidase (GH57 family)
MEKHHPYPRFFALHAHFYQPPRENPWTGKIDPQPSAWPFHDWNSRIARECYLPNACARINDSSGRVLELANNYRHLNFNFGPTLFSWLEKNYPFYYRKIIQAGRDSRERTGHSNAIAQAYNHMIMPLASFQDQLTQALWGIKDFEQRYGFKPEAMWLPETAASDDTLRLMVDLGMKYVILSPYQAEKIRREGAAAWDDATSGNFDTTRPYAWHDTLPDGTRAKNRSLAVFFYDGPLSKAAAFENLTRDSGVFADRVEACYRHGNHGPQLVSMAVDGETFGHHHKFGDMTLAHAFLHELKKRGIETVNYGQYLEANPPRHEVAIKAGPDAEGTAWSCAHGVRRWKGGCDCGREDGANLNWRLPFRAALNSLRDAAADIYAAEAAKFFRAPWDARNDYAALLLDRSPEAADAFFARNASQELGPKEKARAIELLEMQKNAMFMFTSCGWFFSDISRIEAVQNLRYAARAAETLRDLGFENAEKAFHALLEMAHSNYAEAGSGLNLYNKLLAENQLARQKAAALLIAEALLDGEECCGVGGQVVLEERMERGGVLCLRGKVAAPGPDGAPALSFCYLRQGEEFPTMFFSGHGGAARIKEAFALGAPEEIQAALEREPGTARVTFDDFSWEERTLYAWILADSARHSHAPAIFKILEDYLYLLARLPGRALASWAPLRAQASGYARQAAEIVFSTAAHTAAGADIAKLAALAARLKGAGLEAGFNPAPESAAALAMKTGSAALADPTLENLTNLLNLLKAAGDLGAHDLVFHLQNFLMELFRKSGTPEIHGEAAARLKELYAVSGILIERFNSRLEELELVK